MLPSSISRHSRLAFAAGTGAGNSAVVLEDTIDAEFAFDENAETIDFAPPVTLDATYEIDHCALLISALSRQIIHDECDVVEAEVDERSRIRAVLGRLENSSARTVSPEHEELLARMRRFAADTNTDECNELEFGADSAKEIPYVVFDEQVLFEEPSHSRMRVHVELLPDGRRLETFSNGSMLTKDVLGRVVEVRSTFGDCLFLEYSSFGHLEEFARTDSKGFIHSFGKREKHGVAVRDAEGRVRAAGESMTIDPCGCFYLHTLDGQYFSLDLVSGTHCERRRIFQSNGSVDFLTAIFAHDGFRMASMYAVSGGARTCYRFYGRDGTIVEFLSEEDVRFCRPAMACAPGTRPVHKTWLKRAQARTAWESVHDYLSRVS